MVDEHETTFQTMERSNQEHICSVVEREEKRCVQQLDSAAEQKNKLEQSLSQSNLELLQMQNNRVTLAMISGVVGVGVGVVICALYSSNSLRGTVRVANEAWVGIIRSN
jgi:hypothetical protein